MEIIYIIIGVCLGIAIGYLIAKNKSSEIVSARDVLKAKVDGLTQQLAETKQQYNNQLLEVKHNHEEQLRQQNDQFKQQSEQMHQQLALVKEQLTTTSEKILKERTEQLSVQNKEQLSAILNPLKEGITQMKAAVEKSDKDHSERMVALDATIKTSIQQSKEAGERADKLAQALTGENKTQGNFGELRLKQLLEDMGFEEGLQFEEQATLKDNAGNTIKDNDEGKRMIPDVILHFPDKRDIIIDSKMSIKAFEDYHNADNDEDKEHALNRHLYSVRQHILELSRKDYSSYIKNGRQKLDFVLMYVFSESALQLAITKAPNLWKEAYDKGVIITGSQNLYTLLRVLEMAWRQEHQVQNQENIMKTANTIIERVQLFYERFLKVEDQLEKTRSAFAELKTVSSPTGQSIMVAAGNLLKFGAKENPKKKYKIKENLERMEQEGIDILPDNTEDTEQQDTQDNNEEK